MFIPLNINDDQNICMIIIIFDELILELSKRESNLFLVLQTNSTNDYSTTSNLTFKALGTRHWRSQGPFKLPQEHT